MCILRHYLGEEYKSDTTVLKAMDWLTKNYDVRKNPMKKSYAHLYFLYGLERAGILYGTEFFGSHDWYADGANRLLDLQKPDGSWDTADTFTHQGIADTCFAILFLRRGMKPLARIATSNPSK
jgi:hypothetical protein